MDRTRGTRPGRGLLLAALMLAPAAAAQRPLPRDTDHVKLFRLRSAVLSRFWKRDRYVEAGVVLPPRPRRGGKLPAC